MADLDAMRTEFVERFDSHPTFFFQAPGRVNLIGEHTDYNAGLVMPAAIQFYTTVAIAPRADRRLRVRSLNLGSSQEVMLPESDAHRRVRGTGPQWIDYVLGVAWALQEHGLPLGGAEMLIQGEVPLGAGLSSSAALEVAVALAFSSQVGVHIDNITLAKICQRAENEYVGMRCGIMDQFTSVFGRSGHALMIDCRSLDHTFVPLAQRIGDVRRHAQIVICNTTVRHRLADSMYNRRREECEEAVQALSRVVPEIETLRDVTPELLERHRSVLGPAIYRRCRHIVTENVRVSAAAMALEAADLQRFGTLMRESHRSLRDDYEVSCEELDLMVRLADSIEGVFGARMTGGGFGGCTVNLVRLDAVDEFRSSIEARYVDATGRVPEIYVCEAADGAVQVSTG